MIDGIFSILKYVLGFGISIFILNFLLTGINFVVYHLYYGSAISLGYFVTYQTINIMMYAFIGLLIYLIYDYLFKH